MDFALFFKKLITLIALVDPFLVSPLFLAASKGLAPQDQQRFARTLGITVAVGLTLGGLIGMHLLSLLGVSLGAMQLAGGLIALIVSLAMVLSKEQEVKMPGDTPAPANTKKAPLVPLGIPLLVGPAALAYVMATSQIHAPLDSLNVILPPVLVGALTWLVFSTVAKTQRLFSDSALSILERVGGFLLAAISVEMMATGLRSLFPTLSA